jgi:DNA-binding FadR family transcriptional regulator
MPSHLPSSARTTYLAPLDQGGRGAEVERRLADAIRAGVFVDGDQLPSETELAVQLGVSTVTLREALAGLRTAGLVHTRRGRNGGTFVHAPAEEAEARLLALLDAMTVDEIRDLADHRAAIAVAAAGLAAERASATDLDRLAEHVDRLAHGGSTVERRAADARFHVELAATTRSLRLTRAEMDLQKELGALLWLAAGEEGVTGALAHHHAVLDAVRVRDAAAARERMAAHVAEDMATLAALHLRRVSTAEPGVLPPVRDALEEVFTEIERIRETALALPSAPPRSALAPLRDTIHDVLDRCPLIAGAGMVFAPGSLADTRRWLEWWRRDAVGPPVFLNACLDPEDPDFYEYDAAEWYMTPRDTGERWIAGPFVDHSGTDEHILTITVPVVRGGVFLGVSGADITVGSIEGIAGPALAAIDGEAALVNHRGRIIATNAASRLVGTLWPGAETAWPPPSGALLEGDDDLPWTVVVTGA